MASMPENTHPKDDGGKSGSQNKEGDFEGTTAKQLKDRFPKLLTESDHEKASTLPTEDPLRWRGKNPWKSRGTGYHAGLYWVPYAFPVVCEGSSEEGPIPEGERSLRRLLSKRERRSGISSNKTPLGTVPQKKTLLLEDSSLLKNESEDFSINLLGKIRLEEPSLGLPEPKPGEPPEGKENGLYGDRGGERGNETDPNDPQWNPKIPKGPHTRGTKRGAPLGLIEPRKKKEVFFEKEEEKVFFYQNGPIVGRHGSSSSSIRGISE